MNLTAGQRLPSGGTPAYEVVGPAWATPRHEFLRARRLFRNFRYPAEALDEASPEECLDVLIRRSVDPHPGPAELEREVVLALSGGGWFLEPLDYVDEPAGPHHAAAPALLVVLADPHAPPLTAGHLAGTPRDGRLVRVAAEILDMLDALHSAGLALSALDPADLLVDDDGRWFYTGTDRVARAASARDRRADLQRWARLVTLLLGGPEPSEGVDAVPGGLDRRLRRWVALVLGAPDGAGPGTVDELREGRPARTGLFSFFR